MVRFNITMPEDVAEMLKEINNKSKFIADALREKFLKDRKKKLEKELKEAYQDSSKEGVGLEKEWDNTLDDGWT